MLKQINGTRVKQWLNYLQTAARNFNVLLADKKEWHTYYMPIFLLQSLFKGIKNYAGAMSVIRTVTIVVMNMN